MGFNSVFKGLN